MLDREFDAPLQRAQQATAAAALADPRTVQAWLAAANFDREAWSWPLHQPLFEAAAAGGGRWIAGNFSRASARALMRPGATQAARVGAVADTAIDPLLSAMVDAADWPDSAEQALMLALREGHCQPPPPTVLTMMIRMQRYRDAALASPLRDAADRPTLLLAGNGHVRRDHGVPRYLGALSGEALVVGFERRSAPVPVGIYDRIVYTETPSAPAESPCADARGKG